MNLRMASLKISFVLVILFQYCVLADGDAYFLYKQAFALEKEGKFSEALTLYNQICSEYPQSPFAGPDYSGFRTKYISCKIALKNGDIVAALDIAEQIKALPSSTEKKSVQLYMTGWLFETKEMVTVHRI